MLLMYGRGWEVETECEVLVCVTATGMGWGPLVWSGGH